MRIAKALGCARNTVRRYVREGGWKPYADGGRAMVLDEHEGCIVDAVDQHRGNAEVVRQELERVQGVAVSVRTVERTVRNDVGSCALSDPSATPDERGTGERYPCAWNRRRTSPKRDQRARACLYAAGVSCATGSANLVRWVPSRSSAHVAYA